MCLCASVTVVVNLMFLSTAAAMHLFISHRLMFFIWVDFHLYSLNMWVCFYFSTRKKGSPINCLIFEWTWEWMFLHMQNTCVYVIFFPTFAWLFLFLFKNRDIKLKFTHLFSFCSYIFFVCAVLLWSHLYIFPINGTRFYDETSAHWTENNMTA